MSPSCLQLWLLLFLSLLTESHSGQILPPRNLSLVWEDDFMPVLTWKPAQPPSGCKYLVQSQTKTGNERRQIMDSPPWTDYRVMDGGFLKLTVWTRCNENTSEAAVLNQTYPEILKNLQCYVISPERTQCSWEAVRPIPGLTFFYRLVREDLSVSVYDNTSSPLQECPLYIYDGDIRTGCDLEANIIHSIHMLFNGTENDRLFRNTFRIFLYNKVKLPPLNWTVTKAGDRFRISWTPPYIERQWTYLINYTECNKSKDEVTVYETSYELVRVHHCDYNIQIRAKFEDLSTPLSNNTFFGADREPNAVVWAAFVIPLFFAGVAILTFVCCRKNKDHIFPKVPEPRDFLSDIYDNNNKSTIRDLYIPAEEEENCKITLVMDPQNEYKPDY